MKLKIASALAVTALLTACSTTTQPGVPGEFNEHVDKTVHFAFDSAELNQDAKLDLQEQAAWLKQYPTTSLIIEGHCDERGTVEYNLGLGERRAESAKNYLVSLGVTNPISTISYGKNKLPAGPQTTDVGHQLNRVAISVAGGASGKSHHDHHDHHDND